MGTYLFATGAQRQHYGVFGSLGMTASWTTIVDSAGVKFELGAPEVSVYVGTCP